MADRSSATMVARLEELEMRLEREITYIAKASAACAANGEEANAAAADGGGEADRYELPPRIARLRKDRPSLDDPSRDASPSVSGQQAPPSPTVAAQQAQPTTGDTASVLRERVASLEAELDATKKQHRAQLKSLQQDFAGLTSRARPSE